MKCNNDVCKNASGYTDLTAGKAIQNADKGEESSDEVRFYQFLDIIFSIARILGFHIENRMTIKDEKTGKIWY